jgi:hypothetical protein
MVGFVPPVVMLLQSRDTGLGTTTSLRDQQCPSDSKRGFSERGTQAVNSGGRRLLRTLASPAPQSEARPAERRYSARRHERLTTPPEPSHDSVTCVHHEWEDASRSGNRGWASPPGTEENGASPVSDEDCVAERAVMAGQRAGDESAALSAWVSRAPKEVGRGVVTAPEKRNVVFRPLLQRSRHLSVVMTGLTWSRVCNHRVHICKCAMLGRSWSRPERIRGAHPPCSGSNSGCYRQRRQAGSFLKEISAIVRAICRRETGRANDEPRTRSPRPRLLSAAEATLLRSQHLGLGRGGPGLPFSASPSLPGGRRLG